MTPVALIADPSTSSSVIILIAIAERDRGAIFHFREANQTINSSACHISSLEVYRGMKQEIKISHNGFSLNDNGTIEVRHDSVK